MSARLPFKNSFVHLVMARIDVHDEPLSGSDLMMLVQAFQLFSCTTDTWNCREMLNTVSPRRTVYKVRRPLFTPRRGSAARSP